MSLQHARVRAMASCSCRERRKQRSGYFVFDTHPGGRASGNRVQRCLGCERALVRARNGHLVCSGRNGGHSSPLRPAKGALRVAVCGDVGFPDGLCWCGTFGAAVLYGSLPNPGRRSTARNPGSHCPGNRNYSREGGALVGRGGTHSRKSTYRVHLFSADGSALDCGGLRRLSSGGATDRAAFKRAVGNLTSENAPSRHFVNSNCLL